MARLLEKGLAGALCCLIGFWATGEAYAQTAPTDYLVQQVCTTTQGAVVAIDPVNCAPSLRRKLAIGEALPYHKMDYQGEQISDSFPIDDANGITRAVQTFFFTRPSDSIRHPDTLVPLDGQFEPNAFYAGYFPDDRYRDASQHYLVHFDPKNGGYNIIGADGSYVYFRGTYDPVGGWQPWWTPDCQAKGWLLMPSTSFAVGSSGQAQSPTDHYASCPGTVATQASSVDWHHSTFTFATNKSLDSYYAYHFSPFDGAMEATYLTREYGVTRFESWRDLSRYPIENQAQLTAFAQWRCPNVPTTTQLRGHTYTIIDCRDWSKVVFEGTPAAPISWLPTANPNQQPNLPLWPVDPLYTRSNTLKDGYLGGPYAAGGAFGQGNCGLGAWTRTTAPGATLNWAWAPVDTPMTTQKNCTLLFSTPDDPGTNPTQAIVQTQPIPSSANSSLASYGVTLWAPQWTVGTPMPQVRVAMIQMNGATQVGSSIMTVNLTNRPAVFRATATMSGIANSVVFKIYPMTAMTEFQFTGAWVNIKPKLTEPRSGCRYC
ncbi:hypothetical protein [Novosphingobium sp. B 225]|uniref:hypothetical protein n=1 Tax=Novosphingobium sp. B 225 TaxID=1961849 RepID=UPI000B4B4514|nr:hypothetical protein [Novosphingobium sp. B 225]